MDTMPKYSLLIVIMLILVETVFIQFVHYDSQYRSLDPEHYNVEVLSQADFEIISQPENETVELLKGDQLVKGEKWNSVVLPKYKPVNDGSHYVLVKLRGTAPFVTKWYSGVLPIIIVCIFGLFLGLKANEYEVD